MATTVSERLTSLGYTLPASPAPAAHYVPRVRTGNQIYISGQVPSVDGSDAYVGKLGQEFNIVEGQKAPRICALNILAQLSSAVGDDLNRVKRCIRLGGFVNAVPEFGDQPEVINGASDLMVEVLGEQGKHTRAAVGVSSLPRNVPVEVDAIFGIE